MEVSVEEAARRLGVTEEAVRSKLRNGQLPGRQLTVGRRRVWRVQLEGLSAWEARRGSVRLGPGPAEPLPVREVPPVREPVPASGRGEESELVRLRRENRALRAALAAVLGDDV